MPGSRIPLHLLPGQRFSCEGCGRCCRAPWNIAVDGPSRARISGSGLEARVRREIGGPPLVEDREGRVVLARRSGACVFLDPAGRCRIHADLGVEAKPRACRQFPFLLQATPEGVYAGLSFLCPTVQAGRGAPLETAEAELRGFLDEEGGGSLPEATPGWEERRALEAEMRHALAGQPPSEVLRRALERTLGVPRPASPGLEALEAFGAARFVGWLEYPADPGSGEALARALREGRGRARVPRFGWDGPAEELACRLAGQLPGTDLEASLRRYLDALLFRKILVGERPLARTLALLHLALAVLRWYACTGAALRGAPAPGPGDVDRALGICELELVTHARGQDPLLGDFLRMWNALPR